MNCGAKPVWDTDSKILKNDELKKKTSVAFYKLTLNLNSGFLIAIKMSFEKILLLMWNLNKLVSFF